MGNKILVSVFDTEATAFEGLTALKDLHHEGDITVYATSVIVKDHSGNVAVRQTAEKGPALYPSRRRYGWPRRAARRPCGCRHRRVPWWLRWDGTRLSAQAVVAASGSARTH